MATKKLLTKTPVQKAIKGIYNDIMIDLETLGTRPDSAIIAIGAVKFNIDTLDDESFYRVINIESNQHEGRAINADTLVWWLGQTDKAKAIFTSPDRVDLGDALDDLREFIHPGARVWGNGSDFDISMLTHAYGNQKTPWEFYNTRCFRTIKSMPQAERAIKPTNAGAHNALFDAINQAQHLQAIWKVLAK